MPISPSFPTRAPSAFRLPRSRDRETDMRGKLYNLTMISAFTALVALTIQEDEARGGRGGGGGGRGGGGMSRGSYGGGRSSYGGGASRGGYGGSGFSRGGSYSRPSGGYSRPSTRPAYGGVGGAGRPGGVGGVGNAGRPGGVGGV